MHGLGSYFVHDPKGLIIFLPATMLPVWYLSDLKALLLQL
jgi:hypothetical protein